MEFRVLGPLEAVDDRGWAAGLGGARERALLAVLLLAPDAVVPATRLAGELWGERIPQGWPHALRVHVSRLRRALRAAGGEGLLVTRPPGYVLEAGPTPSMPAGSARWSSRAGPPSPTTRPRRASRCAPPSRCGAGRCSAARSTRR